MNKGSPVSLDEAIAFAEENFNRRKAFWPRRLVRYSESLQQGSAMAVAMGCYCWVTQQRQNQRAVTLVDEFRKTWRSGEPTHEAEQLSTRSREIWYLPEQRSIETRGITRLYNAAAFYVQREFVSYENELSRALSMTASDDAGAFSKAVYEFILKAFQREFKLLG